MNDIIDFSLSEYIDEPLRTYSSGMAARLAFTVATKVEPDILIDEALSVGDAEFKQKFSKIKALQEKGVTIIFCSHSFIRLKCCATKYLLIKESKF